MSFQWESPQAKGKAKNDSTSSAAPVVAAGGVSLQAVICRIKTMADMGTRLEIDLPEIEPSMFALLYALRNKEITIVIK